MIIALQTLIFFRESLLTALDRLLRPYYNKFSLSFNSFNNDSDDEESEEQVFAEYDDEKGVVFYPPMYAQRYAAVSDCLLDERWAGKLEKVVDLGHHDMSFIKYLKDVPGIQCILGVDIESIPLRCSSDLLGCDDYIPKRENPLLITLFQGNAADPDYRLIGCDAVIAIEMIEHMMPHDLDRLVHTVFGFIKPWIVVFTTPNGDFNVLFKSLEKNGLRRLDHFFEWSREQFNDWCSNIVVRYPQYTVTCKGIGPGPSDAVHLGCCTQMALFVSKNYHKQQDLSINSLALVANAPSQNIMSDVIDNWDVPELITESNMICPPSNMESYTELVFSEKQSRITTIATVIATPKFSIENVMYQDKMSQCNLDTELGKNFLMFDYEQMYFNVLVPRRKYDNKVYEIEDVASRLNCTTLQVKKFSKTTQNLMAKNKSDSLVHTREVVDEIRNLTRMLNFNKDSVNHSNGTPTWYNINWGDNAPYWNQYYKIVREYNYPFQVKSDDSRILDLISEEINSMVDTYCEDECSTDVNKMKIPIQYLMKSVRHITEDVDKVKDLLEWNGYEIVDDVIIYTRLVDTASVATYEDDWIDNETLSDWDTTDCHSTSLSDGSTVVPDYNGRCLRRALDHKLRKLRSMLTADEDISTELDRVVCRLMKLALRTSKGRETPPPTRWMQCKLLDLLTLTEKSIDRRKKHFIETYPLMNVGFDDKLKSKDMMTLANVKREDITFDIVNKYNHLFITTDKQGIFEDMSRPKYGNIDMELEDDLSETSVEFLKDFEYINGPSPDLVYSDLGISEKLLKPQLNKDEFDLKTTQAWIEEDIEVIPYPNHDYDLTSGDTDQSINDTLRQRYKKCYKKLKNNKLDTDIEFAINESYYQKKCKVRSSDKNKKKEKMRNIKVIKKLTQKNSSYGSLLKSSSSKYLAIKISNYRAKYKKYRGVSLINNGDDKALILNGYQDKAAKDEKECLEKSIINNCALNNNISKETDYDVSATEESYFINIVMDGKEETIALRRTIGTDVDVDLTDIEQETKIHNIHDDLKDIYVKHEVSTENVQSQTIFLNDINEPSTSKGIRHSVSADVQCGPDETVPIYSTLSATTSFTKLPKTCRNGIQIGDSCTDIRIDSTDFGTCTHECNVYGTVTPRKRSPGIQIRDSDKNIYAKTESATMTQELPTQINLVTTNYALNETKLIKAVSLNMKNEDSSSEFCGSVCSAPRSPCLYHNSVKTSELHIKTSLSKEVDVANDLLIQESVRPKLSCGGVHIHTYKERQISEDVVFQGEWQKYKPKPYVKRKSVNSFVAKKGIEPVNKKKKVNSKEKLVHKIPLPKPAIKKPKRTHTEVNIKPKQEIKKRENPHVNATLKSVKPVKVASKLSLRSKIPKVTFAKKSVVLSYDPVSKNVDDKPSILKKNYLPLYLRKNYIALHSNNKKCSNSSKDKAQTHITKIEELTCTKRENSVISKAEEIKRDLLKFKVTPIKNFEYLVFHNKIENNGSTSNNESTTHKVNSRMENNDNKPKSPTSQNSSSCSSPSSIATVRMKKVKNLSSKRNSSCSNKCNFDGTDSGTPSPTRPKKYTKKCRSVKKVEDNIINNKENIPESPKKYNNIKDNVQSSKSVFMGSQKSVYMAQLKSSVNAITKSKTQSNKSSIKIPIAETKNEKQRSSTSVILEKPKDDDISTPLNDRINNASKYMEYKSIDYFAQNVAKNKSVDRLMEGYDIPTMSNNNNNSLDITASVSKMIKMLVDETLDFVGAPFYDDSTFDSATVILSHEDINPTNEDCMSLASFKSVNTNDDIFESIMESDLENALNRTFDSALSEDSVINLAETSFTATDADLLSFKSVPSVSKISECILNNNELKLDMTSNNSFLELFERKEQIVNKNKGGVLAIQAFSGFSINEPVVGDQPDHVNFIDSETGSMTQEFARLATSEELFVSGRSSDSYESCLIEEDAVVPNWLFQIISQQQSTTEEAQPLADPMPLDISVPHAEPLYDANGNLVEPGVIAGAGAGDGRGIHSDNSQDSSGQGSSLSSSNASSEPQSEAIIIDPSAFTNQFEFLGEQIGSTVVIPSLNEATGQFENFLSAAEDQENETITLRIPIEGATRRHAAAASDDADVSSLDTDIPDSSD